NVAKTGAQAVGQKAAAGVRSVGQRAAAAFRSDGAGAAASGASASGQAASEAQANTAEQSQPAWAKRLHRRQQIAHAATTAAHTLRGGDGGGSAQGPSLGNSDS
ncbi:TPA: P-type conjugative transfer protein TrbL, partial [Pseudomonas aeruginosa]|nr:P-type conjugative transfer protein TrbL [Pseudomonas aeruginosa]